jgi:hypothetical protein
VQHKGIATLTLKRVDDLRIAGEPSVTAPIACVSPRVKSADPCALGNIDLAGNRPHGAVIAAVDSRLTAIIRFARSLLEALEHVFYVVRGRAAFCCQLAMNSSEYLTNTLVARRFLSNTIRFAQGPLAAASTAATSSASLQAPATPNGACPLR